MSFRVLIIDDKRGRGRANALACSVHSIETYYDDLTSVCRVPEACGWLLDDEPKWVACRVDSPPEPPHLIILHDTNRSRLAEISKWAFADDTVVVRYTGGVTPAATTEKEIWIREIHSNLNALSSLEAKALIEWVQKGARDDSMPSMLSVRRGDNTVVNIAALAILCQGYLAVHLDSNGHDLVLPDVEHDDRVDVLAALAAMKWSGSNCGEISDLEMKRQSVRSKEWWRSVFAESSRGIDSWFGRTLPKEAEELVRVFWNEENEPVQCGLVARAFLALGQMA